MERDFSLITPENRDQWLQLRASGITGTDMSAIAGKNKYVSRKQVYNDKLDPLNSTGDEYWDIDNLPDNVPIEVINANLAKWQGKIFEPHVAKLFFKNTCLKPVDWFDPTSDTLIRSLEHPLFLGTPDRIIDHPVYGLGILEIKTSFGFGQKAWDTKEVPEMYEMQLQHYIGLSKEFKWGVFAAMVNRELRIIWRERDDTLIDWMHNAGEEFWNENVLPRTIPDIVATPVEVVEGEDKFQDYAEASDFDLDDYTELKELQSEHKRLAAAIDALKENIKQSIGNHLALKDKTGKVLAYYKISNGVSFDDKKFKKDHPMLYGQYTAPKVTKSLDVGKIS